MDPRHRLSSSAPPPQSASNSAAQRAYYSSTRHRHSIGAIATDQHRREESVQPVMLSASASDWAAATKRRASTATYVSMHATDTVLMRTSVACIGTERRHHTLAYRILVDTGHRQFVVAKRFSEFRAFRQQLLGHDQRACAARGCAQSGTCRQLRVLGELKFPRRRLQWPRRESGRVDVGVARERTALLEYFLQVLLRIYQTSPRRHLRCCVNQQCLLLREVEHFLQVDTDDVAVAVAVGDEPEHEPEHEPKEKDNTEVGVAEAKAALLARHALYFSRIHPQEGNTRGSIPEEEDDEVSNN